MFISTALADQWSIGYWSPFGNPACPVSAIQWGGLTHIVQHAALVKPDGTLDITTEALSSNAHNLIATAHANHVAVLLNVVQPYWTGQTTNIQQAVTGHLPALLNNIMTVVNTYGYDGVDIDWEPFVPSTNGAAMKTLAQGLKPLLGNKPLTAAASVTDSAYWATVQTYLDRVDVMTYDLAGTWNPYSWHNSALYDQDGRVWSLNLAMTRYTKAGVPAAKLGLGLAFYGWKWGGGILSTNTAAGINAPREYWESGHPPVGSQIGYNSILPQITTSNYHWDSLAQAPFINATGTSPSQYWYITYDNAASIQAKVKYIAANKLGGWIIWSIGQDYFSGAAHPHPLMDAVQAGSTPTITSTATLPAATQNTAYSTTLSAVGAAPLQWSISSGTLPSGLKLSSAGVLSGTPTVGGTFTFTADASNFAGSAKQSLTLAISGTTTSTSGTTSTTTTTTTTTTSTPTRTTTKHSPGWWKH